MNQIELAPVTCAVLDRIRHSSNVSSMCERAADLAAFGRTRRVAD